MCLCRLVVLNVFLFFPPLDILSPHLLQTALESSVAELLKCRQTKLFLRMAAVFATMMLTIGPVQWADIAHMPTCVGSNYLLFNNIRYQILTDTCSIGLDTIQIPVSVEL